VHWVSIFGYKGPLEYKKTMQYVPRKTIKIEKPEPDDGNWAEDQKERGYYYDDAHGYEQFDPESEDDEADYESESEEPESKS
jgi:hypothetical protein